MRDKIENRADGDADSLERSARGPEASSAPTQCAGQTEASGKFQTDASGSPSESINLDLLDKIQWVRDNLISDVISTSANPSEK